MALDAALATELMQKKWKSDEEQRMAPSQSLAAGLLAGYQSKLKEDQSSKENVIKLWSEKLKDYDIYKNVKQTDGTMKQEIATPRDQALAYRYIAEKGDFPQGPFTLKRKDSIDISGKVPEGMEVTGYDAKGRPIVKKVRNVAEDFANITEGREIAKAKVAAQKEYNEVKSGYDGTIGQLDEMLKLNNNSYDGSVESMKSIWPKLVGKGAINQEFKDTMNLNNKLKNYVARTLKQTFGGQLSDSERTYLDEVYGASPKMTRAEREIAINNIRQMLDLKLQQKQKALDMWDTGNVGKKTITTSLSAEDQQAIDWANANPNDPRSKDILSLHGSK